MDMKGQFIPKQYRVSTYKSYSGESRGQAFHKPIVVNKRSTYGGTWSSTPCGSLGTSYAGPPKEGKEYRPCKICFKPDEVKQLEREYERASKPTSFKVMVMQNNGEAVIVDAFSIDEAIKITGWTGELMAMPWEPNRKVERRALVIEEI